MRRSDLNRTNICPTDPLPEVLVVGPLPPPAFGVSKATQLMLGSPVLDARVRLLHLDTSDPRDLATMGRPDWRNVYLGIKHLLQLAQTLTRERPGAMMLTVSQGMLALLRDRLFVLIAQAFGTPIVAYLRGSGYADLRASHGRLAAHMLRSITKASTRILVLGENLVDMAHRVYPGAQVAVVPNGCPPVLPAHRVGIRDSARPMVLYVGLLSRPKGLEDALTAVQSIATAVPDAEFVFCGQWDPPQLESQTTGLVSDAGLAERVSFPGPTAGQPKADLLARAWVLIVPSHSEGQPWVILEAMSAGVPVVATATGAIPVTVEDGISGFVIPIGDSNALAGRVATLLQDDDLWRRMSRESVRRYEERFTLEQSHGALAAELCEVAREAASKRRQRRKE